MLASPGHDRSELSAKPAPFAFARKQACAAAGQHEHLGAIVSEPVSDLVREMIAVPAGLGCQ